MKQGDVYVVSLCQFILTCDLWLQVEPMVLSINCFSY